MFVGAKPDLFIYAREMRKNPTEAEKKLWEYLRQLRSDGIIFRRQHPIDIFIVDFYCHDLKLVIEVDGEIHDINEHKIYDEGRSGELERYGITIIRFKNHEILNDIPMVMNKINYTIKQLTSPSLPGRGGSRG